MELYESLFTHCPYGVMLSSADGAIVHANLAACRLLGKSEDELRRRKHQDFFPLSAASSYATASGDTKGVLQGECSIRRTDGSSFPAQFTFSRGEDNGIALDSTVFLDISDRLRSEQLANAEAERHRAFFNGVRESITYFEPVRDSKGTVQTYFVVDANPGAHRLFGIDDIRGLTLEELMDAKLAQQRIRQFNRILATGEPLEYEGPFRGREVVARFFRMSPDVVGVTAVDVSVQKAAESALTTALAKSEEQQADLRAVLDAVPAGVWMTRDVRADHVEGNRYASQLLRLSQSANHSLTAQGDENSRHFVVTANGRPIPDHDLPLSASARTGESIRDFEYELVFDDGSSRNMLGNTEPLRDITGAVRGAVGAFIDVTDRVRSERALADALSRFDAFMQALPGHAFIKDPDGRIVYANKAFETNFSLSRDQWFSRTVRELFPPQVADDMEAIDKRVLESSVPLDSRIETVAPDGQSKSWWQTVTLKFKDAVGSTYVGGFALDVTQQQLSEDAVRESEARLRSANAELELALDFAHRTEEKFRQSQKMEAVGRLAGGVAHDFNNLLTVILGNADLLRRGLHESALMEEVDEIQSAGRRASSLTRQLLAFSRKQALAPRVTNISAIVESLRGMFSRLLGEDIEITTKLHPTPYLCLVDPGQIEQVLLNLVVNARDAMPGGGRLSIETDNVMLDERFVEDHPEATVGPHLLISFSDNGAGMSSEIQAHLFEPFFTTKPQGRGTGLGLSTVYGIVRQSGGTIWIYSEVGQGTSVKVYLPQATGAEESAVTSLASEGLLRGTETILLVEDDDAVRRTVATILRRAGYHLIEARNGREAVLICEQYGGSIELVLTDVVMPRVNGREAAERLRAMRPGLRVLFMSGYTENVIVHHGVVDSGVDFLQKPLTASTLLPKVREILDR